MKQAYLITAYKDFDQLYELAKLFSETSYVRIHVDAKSKTITDAQIAQLNEIEGCRAFRMFRIEWGSFTHVRAILALMISALMCEDVSYLHLLTGEDFPLAGPTALDAEFLESDRICLSYIPPAEQPETVLCRYRYKNIMADKNLKNKLLWSLQKGSEHLQEKAGRVRDRIGPFRPSQIYKGLVYISMPRQAAAYVVRYVTREGAGFWNDLQSCQVPEEFFFQTIFMNAPAWRDRIENRELRYMDWTRTDGASPAYLTGEDYDAVMKARQAGCRFARKFHPKTSQALREQLRSELLSANKPSAFAGKKPG